MGAHEKLQQCEQKLQYLVQRVAHLPPCSHSEDDEVPGGSIPAALFGDPHRLSRVAQPKPSSQLEDGGARGRSHGAAQAQVALGSVGCSLAGAHGAWAPLWLEHPPPLQL